MRRHIRKSFTLLTDIKKPRRSNVWRSGNDLENMMDAIHEYCGFLVVTFDNLSEDFSVVDQLFLEDGRYLDDVRS